MKNEIAELMEQLEDIKARNKELRDAALFWITVLAGTIAVILLIGEMSGIIDRVIEGI